MSSSQPLDRKLQPGAHDELLSQYDDLHAMDDAEQEQVIEQIRHDNHKANYIYRVGILVIYGLNFFLYATPITTYLMGTHPKSPKPLDYHAPG